MGSLFGNPSRLKEYTLMSSRIVTYGELLSKYYLEYDVDSLYSFFSTKRSKDCPAEIEREVTENLRLLAVQNSAILRFSEQRFSLNENFSIGLGKRSCSEKLLEEVKTEIRHNKTLYDLNKDGSPKMKYLGKELFLQFLAKNLAKDRKHKALLFISENTSITQQTVEKLLARNPDMPSIYEENLVVPAKISALDEIKDGLNNTRRIMLCY